MRCSVARYVSYECRNYGGVVCVAFFVFFKQNTAYEMRISDWSTDVCSSDLAARVLGAIVAAWLLYYIAQGSPAFDIANGLAANGYDAGSPGGYDIWSALIIEIVLTAGFVWVIMGSTDGRAPAGFAPLAIGLALTLIHLISKIGRAHV